MQPFVSKNHDTSKKGKSQRQQRKPREQYRPSESPEILFLGKTYWKQHQLASNLECWWRGFKSAGRHYVHNRRGAARQYELSSHETEQTDCVFHVMLSLALFSLLFFTQLCKVLIHNTMFSFTSQRFQSDLQMANDWFPCYFAPWPDNDYRNSVILL